MIAINSKEMSGWFSFFIFISALTPVIQIINDCTFF